MSALEKRKDMMKERTIVILSQRYDAFDAGVSLEDGDSFLRGGEDGEGFGG